MSERTIKFLVSGHVDHGKSTLCGHLLYKCGYISEHEMDQLRKKAEENKMKGWEYAYVLDIYDEERHSGKTVDFVAIEFKHEDCNYQLIDTPGHKHFIRSLISGLNQFNSKELIGVLIVSGLDGEFLAGLGNGQTKEDIILMRAVGIEQIIVAINKMDKYEYSADIFNAKCEKINNYISRLGFKRVEYIMISGYYGVGIFDLLECVKMLANNQDIDESYVNHSGNMIEKEVSEVTAQIKLIELPTNIIAPGFECVCHIRQNEYQIVIDQLRLYDIKTKKVTSKQFAKINDIIVCKIKCIDSKNGEANIKAISGDKIIIRQNDSTIGFGKVI